MASETNSWNTPVNHSSALGLLLHSKYKQTFPFLLCPLCHTDGVERQTCLSLAYQETSYDAVHCLPGRKNTPFISEVNLEVLEYKACLAFCIAAGQ